MSVELKEMLRPSLEPLCDPRKFAQLKRGGSANRCAQQRSNAGNGTNPALLNEIEACVYCIDVGIVCILVGKDGSKNIVPRSKKLHGGADPQSREYWLIQMPEEDAIQVLQTPDRSSDADG